MIIHSDGNQARKKVKVVTEILASYCEKSAPTEKAKEHFKRKAYTNGKNTKTNADGQKARNEQC